MSPGRGPRGGDRRRRVLMLTTLSLGEGEGGGEGRRLFTHDAG